LRKISEEKNELRIEAVNYKYSGSYTDERINKIKQNMGLKAFVLIQATYTFLHNNFTEKEIDELNLKHLKKLEDRQK
jgi:hypothetical protein